MDVGGPWNEGEALYGVVLVLVSKYSCRNAREGGRERRSAAGRGTTQAHAFDAHTALNARAFAHRTPPARRS